MTTARIMCNTACMKDTEAWLTLYLLPTSYILLFSRYLRSKRKLISRFTKMKIRNIRNILSSILYNVRSRFDALK